MKNKVLSTDVVKHAIVALALADLFSGKWKKQYRYMVIMDFRNNLRDTRDELVTALELDKDFILEKRYHYSRALANLTRAEADMMEMIDARFNIMSDKEFAEFAEHVFSIREMTRRLLNSLAKSGSSSDSAYCGKRRESAE